MANYRVLGEIADSIEFQRRIRIAAGVVSSQVYVEGAGVAGHASRLAFALRVVVGNFNLQSMAYLIVTNATIAAEAIPSSPVGSPSNDNGISDAHILTAVAAVWSALAGA